MRRVTLGFCFGVLAAFLAGVTVQAQQATPAATGGAQGAAAPAAPVANPVSAQVRQILERESKLITAAVDEMPADKYSYKPTAEQMTFAHLVVHMANTNNFLCAKISGGDMPTGEKLADTDPKDKLVAALKASFDSCTTAMAKADDSNLGEMLTLSATRTMSRAGVMITLSNDFYDHYSMAAIYLRLNGLVPPSAQPK